jgi:hypothetical protein
MAGLRGNPRRPNAARRRFFFGRGLCHHGPVFSPGAEDSP